MKTFEELLALVIKEKNICDYSVEEITFGLKELKRQVEQRRLSEDLEPKNMFFSPPIFYEVPFNELGTEGMTIIDNGSR
jgi:hypothetical protein